MIKLRKNNIFQSIHLSLWIGQVEKEIIIFFL